jgi:mannose-6-phosphate isomerase-like protein (cupin superfamily)
MLVRDVAGCSRYRVLDRSLVCELLHSRTVPEMAGIPLSVAHAIVPFGQSTLPHRLNTATELYYILTGTGRMHIGTESVVVHQGQVVLIPQKETQSLENCGTTDLSFLCIVTPTWSADDEELVC